MLRNWSAFACLSLAAAFGADAGSITLRVTDEAGLPVPGAQACVLGGDSFVISKGAWISAGADGSIVAAPEQIDAPEGQRTEFMVRAPGMAPQVIPVTLGPEAVELPVRLSPGKVVTLTLKAPDGMSIPSDVLPLVFFERHWMGAWIHAKGWTGSSLKAAELPNPVLIASSKPGTYTFNMPMDAGSFYVLVSHPGFLRAFQAGPFTSEDISDGAIDAVLPAPGSIHATFGVDPAAARPLPYEEFEMVAYRLCNVGSNNGFFDIATFAGKGEGDEATWSDLAPGNYMIIGSTGSSSQRQDHQWKGRFEEDKRCEVKSGATGEVEFKFLEFNEERALAALKGDLTASITVTNMDGSPSANQPWRISVYNGQAGRYLTVAEGMTDAEGKLMVSGLAGQDRGAWFTLNVGEAEAGTFGLSGDPKQDEMTMRLPPNVGAVAPDLTLSDVYSGQTVRLSDFRGQILFLDFWATWCGPCQEPMAHNSEIMARKAEAWKGKAAILGLSIDTEAKLAADHCESRGWDNVRQLWCPGEKTGWGSDAVQVYGIRGVPTAYLLGRDGRILWTGHPASIDVEAKIEEELARE